MTLRSLRRSVATPFGQMVALLALTSLTGLAMLAFRFAHTGRMGYWSLPWDLFLAWVPVPFAMTVARMQNRRPVQWTRLGICAGLWLLFFPNAPYLVTQFMHLHPSHAVYDGPFPFASLRDSVGDVMPLWYDVVLLATYAWTGLMLGFVSLHLIHRAARDLAGPACGWAVVVAGLTLGAFGISLGRFERWNSWDLFTRPLSLLSDVTDRIINPMAHARTSGSTVLLAGFLMVAYLTVVALTQLGRVDHREPPRPLN